MALLWRTFQPLLLRYARGHGFADAQEVTTEVWIGVVRNLSSFHGGAEEFRRWLFAIAYRRMVDERRRWARQAGLGRPITEHSPSADVDYEQLDGLDQAIRLVSRLPDAMANAVLLRVVADLSVRETARIMGVRDGYVRVLVHRGLRRLEELLQEAHRPALPAPVRAMETSM